MSLPFQHTLTTLFGSLAIVLALLLPVASLAAQTQPLAVTGFRGVQDGQALARTVGITAQVQGARIARVEFALTGPKIATWTERHAPYVFLGDRSGQPLGWQTTRYPDGNYTLTATAVGRSGQRASRRVTFRVANTAAPTTGTAAPTTGTVAPATGTVAPTTGTVAPATGTVAPATGTPAPAGAQHWSQSGLPTSGAVTVPAGQTVLLDTNLTLTSLQIDGMVICADQDLQLSANWIMVHGQGKLQCGTAQQPFAKKLTVTLTGNNTSEDVMGMGTKFLGAMMGGQIDLHGQPRTSWTKLNATAPKGATQLTLDKPVDWQPGDTIVIASSSIDPAEAEERTITAVNGAIVTLNAPLKYQHWGELQTIAGQIVDERAEVGLLTRTIVIQGDDGSVASQFGGHVMVMDRGSNARISHTEFVRMGQFDHLGRYPMHWHLVRDATGGAFVGNSIHNSIQRGLVVHGTDNLQVSDNVIYNTVGHAYVLEDGSERGNTFERNLGLSTKAFKSNNATLAAQNDDEAATFWVKAPNNRFVGNVAAGGQHIGYWFDNVGKVDASQFLFSKNVAHSYLSNLQGPYACCIGEKGAVWITGGSFDAPMRGPFDLSELTLYKNRQAFWAEPHGSGNIGATVDLHNSILADNQLGTGSHGLRDSLIIGRSANPDSDPYVGQQGVQEYGFTTILKNVTFANFTGSGSAIQTRNCFREGPHILTEQITLVNAQLKLCNGSTDLAIHDRDGSLAGTNKPSTIVSAPFQSGARAMSMAGCIAKPEWNASICPQTLEYANLFVEIGKSSTTVPNPSLKRADGVVLDGADIGGYPSYWTLISGQSYTMELDPASWNTLRFRLGTKYNDQDGVLHTGRVVMPINAAPTVSRCTLGLYDKTCSGKTALTPVASLQALAASSGPAYYYDAATKQVHIQVATSDTSILIERAP